MAEDLKELEQQITERQNQTVIVSNPADNTVRTAGELVDAAFNTAIITKVKTDIAMQDKLVNAAGQVIESKVNAVVSKADEEDKKNFFDNNVDACALFCYTEKTTSKSLVNTMRRYKYILDLIYIWTIGMFLVAPIMFFAYKIKNGIKSFWWSILLGILIYVIIIGTPILIGLLRS